MLESRDVIDMEAIDPAAVKLPRWYRPNPGRAGDLAFILFSGEGENTRASRITNRRWAQSAFGTASSAALTPADTLYSVTPVSHPSGLMASIGGAIVGGARLAMARRFEVSTFWEEIRRYGVTVATYTWTLLDEIVDAPPQPAERHHPLRLFIGSGMPRGLWRRVEQRFQPARVVEFYASTEAGAILVNLGRGKIGAMGRPLPGSAEVRIARYDLDAQGLLLNRDGFAERCRTDEVGMLMARVSPTDPLSITPLRSLFRRDDAWVATGDLFRRDADGDYWRVDGVADVIHTARGHVFTAPITGCARGYPGRRPCPRLRRAPRGGPGRDRSGGGHGASRPVTHAAGADSRAGGAPARWASGGGARRRADPGHHLVQADDPGAACGWAARAGRRRAGLVPGRFGRDLPATDRGGTAAADAVGRGGR